MNKADVTKKIYHQIGAEFFLIISTAHIAGLWVNYGLPFFKDLCFIGAFLINIALLLPFILGFIIYRKLQRIDRLILYSLGNMNSLPVAEADKLIEAKADAIIDNSKEIKNIAVYSLIWLLWIIGIIIIITLRLINT